MKISFPYWRYFENHFISKFLRGDGLRFYIMYSCFYSYFEVPTIKYAMIFLNLFFLMPTYTFLDASTLCLCWLQWLNQPEPCQTMLLIQSLSSYNDASFFRFEILNVTFNLFCYLFNYSDFTFINSMPIASEEFICDFNVMIACSVAWLIGWALILEYTIGGSAVARGISPNLVICISFEVLNFMFCIPFV